MYLLDTTVVSELRKSKPGGPNHRLAAWASNIPASALFISAITIFELEKGVLKIERRDAPQGALMRDWLNRSVLQAFREKILPVDEAIASRCAGLHVPDPRADWDALIAATALVHGMTMVTRNVVDFKATGVKLLNPWDEPGLF